MIMDHTEAEIRARCEAEKDKVMAEIRAGRWHYIRFDQVCRDLNAQMNVELRQAREQREEKKAKRNGRVFDLC